MEDNYRHKGLRRQLIEEVRAKGIHDDAVLAALDRVPRHLFMDNAFLNFAYQDKAFPIGAGQTISQPYTVAFQTMMLEIQKGEKVLEIGTGSGYQTAVLCEMGAKVFTIERQKELFDKVKPRLSSMGYAPRFNFGDGYKGWPAFAPFDKIIVTAGAPFVPQPLLDQLKVGGRLIIPVGQGDSQVMTLYLKKSAQESEKHELGQFRFVPLLEDRAWSKE